MQDYEFAVGDLAVYPAHGVAKVEAIESRELGGQESTFYVLRVLDNNMRVMVPVTKSVQVGLRNLVGDDEIDAFDLRFHHVGDGVAARTADADDHDLGTKIVV